MGRGQQTCKTESLQTKKSLWHIPVLLGVVVTLVLPGTAAIFLLTSVLELVLWILGRRVNRVLAFPSGPGASVLDFLGGGGGGGSLGLGLRLAVGRRKDAEGDRNSRFKVQIDGLGGAGERKPSEIDLSLSDERPDQGRF